MNRKEFRILNTYHLKIIALVTMIFDHIGFILLPQFEILRIIGRIAFILYAFMLVEGFFHTKNIKKYIYRIFIWAFVSEIPFDLATRGKFFDFETQNIFFTLLVALLAMYFLKKSNNIFLSILIVIICFSAAIFLKVDYSWYGIALIFTFYFLRKYPPLMFAISEGLSLVASFKIFIFQFFAFLGFIPILLYNGKPGKRIGTIYYSFYAIHLLIIVLIKCFLKFI